MTDKQSTFKAICERADVRATSMKSVIVDAFESIGYPTDDEAMTLWKFMTAGHMAKVSESDAEMIIAFAKAWREIRKEEKHA